MTIVQVYIFFTLVLLGLGLTLTALKRPHILLSFSAFFVWFALGIIFLTNAFGTSLNDDWTIYVGVVFILMSFASLLMLMDTEITMEKDGKRWTEYGGKPTDQKETDYERYRRELRRRTRR